MVDQVLAGYKQWEWGTNDAADNYMQSITTVVCLTYYVYVNVKPIIIKIL